ncbi:MAG TPA: ABC transporter permease [Solirubrobacteraceae bacterium]|nr:ABC transporter permease [Solirubrobacteraceae bacterium]
MSLSLRIVQTGPVLILGLVVVVMTALSPFFLTERNITNLGFQTSIVAVLALGQLLVILTRGIDLSVGAVVALGGVVGGIVAGGSAGGAGSSHGALVLLAMIACGAGVGLLNGTILIAGRVMNPFIVTLGMLSIVRGAALVISDAQTVTGMPEAVQTMGTGLIGPLPVPAVLVAVLALVAWVLLTRTQWGRWIYAVGGDPDAARRVGIPVDRVLLSVFVLCGAAAGVAAILVAGRTNAGSPTAGQLLELDAITAVVIGGASFFGGRGSVFNVIAGALIIGVLRNGLNLLDVTPFWQSIAIGVLVIASLELDVLRGRLEERLRVAQA